MGVTNSIFEIGLIVASFSFAQILSEIYFGRHSDRKGTRLQFIRIGFIGCAVTFGLHYFADDITLLFLARIGAGIFSGIMIPAMIAYAYESTDEKRKVATIISFHALGWMAGIIAAGFVNDVKMIFIVSSGFFIMGFLLSTRLPNIVSKKELESGTIKKIILKNKYLKQVSFLVSLTETCWSCFSVDNLSNNVDGTIRSRVISDIYYLYFKHVSCFCFDESDGKQNQHFKCFNV